MNYKQAALQVLRSKNKPLHYKEITEIALKEGLISSNGKTPWATMNARLAMDIVNKGNDSLFIRTKPGYYFLNPKKVKSLTETVDKLLPEIFPQFSINKSLTAKQKGDIGEARVAELITLYGVEGLSCYQPISDDEGIDLIVKRRGQLDVVYVQIKTTYGLGTHVSRGFVSSVKESRIHNKTRHLMVFVYFDLSKGDLYDNIFCIPASDFLKLTENENRKNGYRVFTVGLKNPDKSKYAEFMIEKRELANKIIEIMDKL